MSDRSPTPGEKETGRLEAFSDGVFSIAMTLLVLELKVPTLPKNASAAELCNALGNQWPSYFAFATSFFTVLVMWANHHAIFRLIHRTNANLIYANGFLLLLVTAVPFPTALVATFLRTPAAPTACAVYAGTFVVISISYALVLAVASRGTRLLAQGAEAEVRKRIRDCLRIGFPLYLLATIAAPFSVFASLGICTALWIFWAVVSGRRGGM